MYVGVDVGGTKTLLAVLNDHGEIVEEKIFPTPKNYSHWLLELRHQLAHFQTHDFQAGGVGIPAVEIDRQHGRGNAQPQPDSQDPIGKRRAGGVESTRLKFGWLVLQGHVWNSTGAARGIG